MVALQFPPTREGLARKQAVALRANLPGVIRLRRLWSRVLPREASRLLDLLAAVLGLALFAILSCVLLFPPLQRTICTGRRGRKYAELGWRSVGGLRGRIIRRLHLCGLPCVWNLLRGEIALVGPTLTSLEQQPSTGRQLRRCRDVAPGIWSLFGLRRATSIDFEDELATEADYIESRSWKRDLGVMFRSLLTALYGGGAAPRTSADVRHLGVRIDNLTMQEACEWMTVRAQHREAPVQVTFVNAHCMNVACTDAGYRAVLDSSVLVLADGIGMKLAGKLLKRPIVQNVNGTDLFPRLCARLRDQGLKTFLLGGQPGVAETVAQWMRTNFPGCIVAGTQHGYFGQEHAAQVAEQIRHSGADLLLVAMGVPSQDKWIAQNLAQTGVAVAVGVGGLFDFYSNRIPRAPMWLRELGLEWAYRLYCEPGRMWRRYIVGNLVFLARVLRERWTGMPPLREETR